jgi:hypothetical protein
MYNGCGRFYVPPTNSNLVLLKLLKKNIKYLSVENGLQKDFESKNWSRFNKTAKESANNNLHKSCSSGKIGTTRVDTEPTVLSTPSNQENKGNVHIEKGKPTIGYIKASSSKTQKSKPEVKFSKKDTKSENLRSRTNKKNQKVDKSDQLDLMENWFECWQTKSVVVLLNYAYYPCPVINWNNERLPSVKHYMSKEFKVREIEEKPDLFDLQIDIGPSIILVYGKFLRNL